MRQKRRSANPRRATVIAAIAGALVLAGLGYSALTAGNGLPGFPYYYLNADFRQAGVLDPHSDVRIGGVLVGQVLSTTFHDGVAVVRMQLNPSAGPLRSDTTARIRLRGLIGAKLVALSPGRSGAKLSSGATLPVTQTSTSVAVFDVLSTFDAPRRADLRAVLGGLGQGLLARGAGLNEALTAAPGVVSDVRLAADTVNARAGAAQRLVPSTQALSAALDPVRDDVSAGFDPAARALEPLIDQRPSVQTTLTVAPGALDAIRQGLAQTDPLLSQTTGFARAAVTLTGPAPAALHAAAVLLTQAQAPLQQARTLIDTLGAAAPPATGLFRALSPLVAPLGRSLANSIPALDQLSSYGCDFEGWARDWNAGFALGTPPQTAIGATGIARAALSNNTSTASPNTPGGIPADAYPAPCTGASEHLP